mmetsp:Transcript_3430/g.5689  ORF Transcript_3430/g.5689 Transcript_3430/m.5689 type:complete len:253 (-) Transcript_3430:1730-2488(-)
MDKVLLAEDASLVCDAYGSLWVVTSNESNIDACFVALLNRTRNLGTKRIFDSHQGQANQLSFGFEGIRAIRVLRCGADLLQVKTSRKITVGQPKTAHTTSSVCEASLPKIVSMFSGHLDFISILAQNFGATSNNDFLRSLSVDTESPILQWYSPTHHLTSRREPILLSFRKMFSEESLVRATLRGISDLSVVDTQVVHQVEESDFGWVSARPFELAVGIQVEHSFVHGVDCNECRENVHNLRVHPALLHVIS